MKKKLILPKFKDEDDEREFWSHADLTDYFEATDFRQVTFKNLKPSTERVTIRLTSIMLSKLKKEANKIDIPYQTYMKQILANALESK